MQIKPLENITQLSTYRASKFSSPTQLSDRQLAVREHCQDVLKRTADQAPTAIVGIAVQPDGKIQSFALQVEPEHVIPMLSAMRSVMEKLESYLTSSLVGRHLVIVGVWAALQAADLTVAPAMAAGYALIK